MTKINREDGLVTVIEFARAHNKLPQQIYGGIKNGSFPSNLITYVNNAKGQPQPMVHFDEAHEWLVIRDSERLAKLQSKPATQVYAVEQLIQDLVSQGKKGLATQITNFIKAQQVTEQ